MHYTLLFMTKQWSQCGCGCAYRVNKLRQNVGLETRIWRQVV